MSEVLEDALLHLVDELSERPLRRDVGAKDDRVDEIPDQALGLCARPIRRRASDRRRLPPAQPREEELEGGEEHGEERGLSLRGKGAQ